MKLERGTMFYHLTATGPAPCRATKRPCPLGGGHYPTQAEAQRAYEKVRGSQEGTLPPPRRAWKSTASKDLLTEGFGGLTSGALADKLLALDGEYGSILEGDLQNGACGDLASLLAKSYGGKHLVVVDKPLWEEGQAYSVHAIAELPDGRLLDSRGVWTGRKEVEEAWGGSDDFVLVAVEAYLALSPGRKEELEVLPTEKVRTAALLLAEEVGLKPLTS